jgi:predicted nucleotidyltransferase
LRSVHPIADVSLTRDEHRLLERFVVELRELLGDELSAVWLFGSRARGEPAGEDSDIDLLVLAGDASWDAKERIHGALAAAAADLDLAAVAWDLSIHVHTPEWLHGRREIRSFFIAEVDRDRVVLHGEP